MREGRVLLFEGDLEELRSGRPAALAGGAGSPATGAGGGRGGSDGGGRGWSRRMMGKVLSASTTVLADSTIRLTTSLTTPSVRRTASVRATASKPSPLQCQSRTRCRAREFCSKILFFAVSSSTLATIRCVHPFARERPSLLCIPFRAREAVRLCALMAEVIGKALIGYRIKVWWAGDRKCTCMQKRACG